MKQEKSISHKVYSICLNFVKYFPILMQFIILFNFYDYYFHFSITNWLYPLIGHSLAFDLLLLSLSRMFRFCLWHRLLIYSMIMNISFEWISVNFDISNMIDDIMNTTLVLTIVFIISSIISRKYIKERIYD